MFHKLGKIVIQQPGKYSVTYSGKTHIVDFEQGDILRVAKTPSEQHVEHALKVASNRCGLLSEEQLESIESSIRSGLTLDEAIALI